MPVFPKIGEKRGSLGLFDRKQGRNFSGAAQFASPSTVESSVSNRVRSDCLFTCVL